MAPQSASFPSDGVPSSWILTEPYAGLQSQALGLAEAAGLAPDTRTLTARFPWRYVSAPRWPWPLSSVQPEAIAGPRPGLILSCGGMAAAVGSAIRSPDHRVVHIQNPRMAFSKFDLIIVNRHDEVTGPNVIVTRTALHRVTQTRLEEARARWAPVFAHLPRPLVAVLVGGTNGRFKLDAPVAANLAQSLAGMMDNDHVGLMLTPSRRTDPKATAAFRDALEPRGAYVWDGAGENPYFGMLALADMIVVTIDSVSMVSEGAATAAPVMLAPLPGRSRRIGIFTDGLIADGRVRHFQGRYEHWPVAPLDDTAEAAQDMRRRLGF
ncbi:mitochondrial fission ELM1 family protein [Acidisoma cellulosilytica]|uniref:Mitochondrial fission ELM1 family protein n=1 Tax=Acidisoma cellulosilyticum TaxID=2802395 RepID=A0A963Z0C4_9PROT|nr:mitochondrial fission ELM1 family protein [Acidisoma cellulosilyticum]MCB8879672.1 mitochondrial fission ELM1 family protein [Acidisoma cellulosilyticum]